MKTKVLLYCTKGMPLLYENPFILKTESDHGFLSRGKYITSVFGMPLKPLNGKIVAKCDVKTERIVIAGDESRYFFATESLYDIQYKSCLTTEQLKDYLVKDNAKDFGYALHIMNLNIFDKPKELSDYCTYIGKGDEWISKPVTKAPQNMQYVWLPNEENGFINIFALISIRPEWLCKILNGEKPIEVRRNVLKKMKEEL